MARFQTAKTLVDEKLKLLKKWNKPLTWLLGDSSDSNVEPVDQQEADQQEADHQEADGHQERRQELAELSVEILEGTFALRGLSDYILPLIYGLLGAFAFVLRKLTNDLETLSYTRESRIRYGLRLQLGALAGLAIGWFLAPEQLEEGLSAFSSPWAIAFVAGYSVEILFAQLDKMVVAFSGESVAASATRGPTIEATTKP